MSFPFYSRSSSKSSRAKNTSDTGNKHVSASFATGAFNHDPCDPPRSRGSSKMRMIPFLGRRRKSLAALRSSEIAEGEGGAGHGHHKTVSQLANETASRLTRSSLGAVGSRSTGNLDLATLDTSALKAGSGSAYITPTRNRSDARHTMFPSGSTKNSTPDKLASSQDKRSSQKPAKASFLSRITSRPSLAARYSSADLKSSSKARGFFETSEKPQAAAALRRKEMIHPIHISNDRHLGDDKHFFTSPRVAPTPPNLSFATPDSSLLESPLDPSQSTTTLPSQKHSPLFVKRDLKQSPSQNHTRNANIAHVSTKRASSQTTVTSPSSLSPEIAFNARRQTVTVRDQRASPETVKTDVVADRVAGSHAVRPRGSHVRIGKEKVTISVANMLEAELGVEVGDSEDSSHYDDSYEDTCHLGNQATRPNQRHSVGKTSLKDSSDLPPLGNSSDNFGLAFSFPKINGKAEGKFALESQSPLSALMSASSGDNDHSPSDGSTRRLQHFSIDKASKEFTGTVSHTSATGSQQRAHHEQTGSLQRSKMSYIQSLGSQSRGVDRLDSISEKSLPLYLEAPLDTIDKVEKEGRSSSTGSNSAITSQLQHALDVQCARFDKLAGHLLQIIQRHQCEKVQLESQITALQKEARRNEREALALRKLIAHSNNTSSQEGRNSRRLVRVASVQSFLSNISVNDEVVEMSVVMDMLARAGRRDALLSDVSRDGRASVDLSPTPMLTRFVKTDLRRSRTMPDLHKVAAVMLSPMPSPAAQDTSPEISGIGLGLDFPLPEPLKLPSIASTIMSSAQGSAASVPALTAASTAASGLSLATEPSINGFTTCPTIPSNSKPTGVRRGTGRSAREKRMAGEWLPGAAQGFYRPIEHFPQLATPNCEVPALPASTSYANNLNKVLAAPPVDQVTKAESPDLDAIFKKLVTSPSRLLG